MCDTSFEDLKKEKQRLVQDLINEVQHKKGCHCELCLWREEQKGKRPGRPYDFLTFLIPDLIHDLKVLYLKDKGLAKKVKKGGKEYWEYPPENLVRVRDRDIIPRLKEILGGLAGFEGFPAGSWRDVYLDNLDAYVTHKRFSKVLGILDKVDSKITEKNLKKRKGRPKKNTLILWKGIRDFIEEKGPVSKREIQRKFHLSSKDFENHIWFIKKFSKLKSKSGQKKNQVLYF